MLVVWADRVDQILGSAEVLEKALIAMLWSEELEQLTVLPTLSQSGHMVAAESPLPQDSKDVFNIILPEGESKIESEAANHIAVDIEDPEKADVLAQRKARPVVFLAPVVHGLAAGLIVVLVSMGISKSNSFDSETSK